VLLYYLEGKSLQETADELGLPLGTVKSRVHHALRDLRVRLSADRRFGGAWGDLVPDDVEAGGS
jgi:RNA polymerase sigma-70 factor (ECF subfamily)